MCGPDSLSGSSWLLFSLPPVSPLSCRKAWTNAPRDAHLAIPSPGWAEARSPPGPRSVILGLGCTEVGGAGSPGGTACSAVGAPAHRFPPSHSSLRPGGNQIGLWKGLGTATPSFRGLSPYNTALGHVPTWTPSRFSPPVLQEKVGGSAPRTPTWATGHPWPSPLPTSSMGSG